MLQQPSNNNCIIP